MTLTLARPELPVRGKIAAVRRWLSVALAVLLLTAEIFALTHPLDSEAHAAGEPCTICLSASSFGGAAPAYSAPVVAYGGAAAPAVDASFHVALPRREAPVARGPPIVS